MLNRLRALGWTEVERWVADHEPETNHLEFKRKHHPNVWQIEPDDCATIAVALSALANTGGGVLVIGVDAGGGTKRGADFDRVRRVDPVADVSAFGGALERRIASFTDPPVEGLEVLPVLNGEGPSGVVAVNVPRSDGGPHRAVAASRDVNDRYYMRTGSAAVTMPHALLADRFGRTATPQLRLRVRAAELSPVRLVLSLENAGRGAARRPAIILRDAHLIAPSGRVTWPTGRGHDGESRFVITPLPYGEMALEGWLFEPFEGDMIVYPGVRRGVYRLSTTIDASPDRFAPFRFEFRAELHAVGAQPVHGRGCLDVPTFADFGKDSEFTVETR